MQNDASEKEVADIKDKTKPRFAQSSNDSRTPILMLMRHDCVGDNGIRDGTKAWKRLQEKYQRVETPTLMILVAQLN